jgi:hypothetical protein
MSKRAKKGDHASVGVWGDAVCSALRGDRRELVELLRHHNKPPDDVLEFIAWLLDERERHRPRLPPKFKDLNSIARNPAMFDAVMDLKMQRANWRATYGSKFPYREKLEETARRWGVDENALQTKDRRSERRT